MATSYAYPSYYYATPPPPPPPPPPVIIQSPSPPSTPQQPTIIMKKKKKGKDKEFSALTYMFRLFIYVLVLGGLGFGGYHLFLFLRDYFANRNAGGTPPPKKEGTTSKPSDTTTSPPSSPPTSPPNDNQKETEIETKEWCTKYSQMKTNFNIVGSIMIVLWALSWLWIHGWLQLGWAEATSSPKAYLNYLEKRAHLADERVGRYQNEAGIKFAKAQFELTNVLGRAQQMKSGKGFDMKDKMKYKNLI